MKLTLLGALLICLIHINVAQIMDMSKTMSMIKTMQGKSMGKPDPRVGKMIAEMTSDDKRNPEEMGTYMEGDMLQTNSYRAGIKPMWPGGIVTYAIAGDFNREQTNYILEAMREIESNTCIRFQRYTGEQRDYIEIKSKYSGCWSSVGRTGGKQELNLQVPGCVRGHGTPMHEFLHALGFPHEHTRSDRNEYVQIKAANIEPGNLHNFRVTRFSGLGVKYDYDSIMHYSKFAFSKNYLQTIYPRKTDVNIGQRTHLSPSDAEEINRLYYCPETLSIEAKRIKTPEATTTTAPKTAERPLPWQELFFRNYKYDPNTKKIIKSTYFNFE